MAGGCLGFFEWCWVGCFRETFWYWRGLFSVVGRGVGGRFLLAQAGLRIGSIVLIV